MKICTWGNVVSALEGKPDGGGELQIALIMNLLAKSGNEVIVIDYFSGRDFETNSGVKVLGVKGWNDGFRFVRFFSHRFPRLYTLLKEQNADLYYCQICDFRHILSYWASRKTRSKFVIGVASDLDLMTFRKRLSYFYQNNKGGLWWFFNAISTGFIYPWLLKHSDMILVQHEGQKDMLVRKNLKSLMFNNLFDLSTMPAFTNIIREDFCYVGALDKRKGFGEFFELVEKTPNATYKVIGEPRDKMGHYFYEKLKSFENVTLKGKLSHSETIFEIANSKALISTSHLEGFPNIFIEAWACGVPVYSLFVDPGSVIEKENLGYVAKGKMEELVDAIKRYEFSEDFAVRSRSYVSKNHAINESKIYEVNSIFARLSRQSA